MHVQGPGGSILSLREFLVHIAVVTLGILIALGLEQLRETVHDRNLVRETRDLLYADMRADRSELAQELQNVDEMARQLAQLHEALAEPTVKRSQLQTRVEAIVPAGYFFSTSAWQTALSTGALIHMPVVEVAKLNEVYFLVDQYTRLEHDLKPVSDDFRVFNMARGEFRAEDLVTFNEKRCRFALRVAIMSRVGDQLGAALDRALGLAVRGVRKYQPAPGC